MDINDIILVKDGDFPETRYSLLTTGDFLFELILPIHSEEKDFHVGNVLKYLNEISEKTDDTFANFSEISPWLTGIHARYCKDEAMLIDFLDKSSVAYEYPLNPNYCSKECLNTVRAYGYNLNGTWMNSNEFSYDYLDFIFYKTGDVVRQSVGREYMVMDKFADSNYLLKDLSSGNFIVAEGIRTYFRHPKDAPGTREYGINTITWDGAVLLPAKRLSDIDFASLNKAYGDPELNATVPNASKRPPKSPKI